MMIEISDGTLKKRTGKYVVYDVDYLLNHLAQEIYLLEHSKLNRKDAQEILERIRKEVNGQ